jgi:hypothetical protein
MNVSRIYYKDVLGIEELDIRPGKVTRISGKNGTGKSSVIEGLKAMVRGGYDGTLLRAGAEEGEVVLVVDGPADGPYTFRKRLLPDKDGGLELKNGENKTIGRAKEQLMALVDTVAFNPITFIKATGKDKTRILLESMDLRITKEDLTSIGVDAEVDLEQHALTALAAIRQDYYDTRHGVNQIARRARATEKDLLDALPEEMPDVRKDLDKVKANLATQDEQVQCAKAKIGEVMAEERARIEADAQTAKQAKEQQFLHIVGEIDKQIAILQAQRTAVEVSLRTNIAAIEAERDKQIDVAKAEANAKFAEFKSEKETGRSALLAQSARMEEQLLGQQRREQSMAIVDERRIEAVRHEEEGARLTGLLTAIDGLQAKLLANLPIKGLEYKEGCLYKDGIAVDRLNTAKQVGLSLTVAKMRQSEGQIGLVNLDGLECLDDDTFAIFEKQAQKMPDMQFLYTYRSTEPQLTVEVDPVEGIEEREWRLRLARHTEQLRQTPPTD